MSRHHYSDECEDYWASIRWRGAVRSAIRGKRGQAFLREMLAALDAMPEKRLVRGELVTDDGDVCAIGSVCRARGLDVSGIDETEPEEVAAAVGIAVALAREIAYENDDAVFFDETPEHRWQRIRNWIAREIASVEGKSPVSGGEV